MKVSVLMAVYNGEATIGAAVESVLAQTHKDWELLIVDDGSTDNTAAILQSLSATDSRIRIISSRTRRGLATSLNEGWRQAKGELIARMDADDRSLPARFERQIEFLRSHPEVDVLGTSAEAADEKGDYLGLLVRPVQHEDLVQLMYKENPFAHPSVMMRRKFLEQLNGYDEKLKRSQDYDLWLRGYRRFRYHNLPEPLIRYTVRKKPTASSCFYSSFVLLRSALRENLLFSRGWCALRPLAWAASIWLGLRTPSAGAGPDRTGMVNLR